MEDIWGTVAQKIKKAFKVCLYLNLFLLNTLNTLAVPNNANKPMKPACERQQEVQAYIKDISGSAPHYLS